MTVTIRQIVLAAVVLVAAGLLAVPAARRYLQSDEALIRGRLDRLAALISKGGEEKTSSIVLKHQGFLGLFHNPSTLVIPNTFLAGSFTPDEVASNAARARASFETISFSFNGIEITAIEGGTALATATATLRGRLKTGENIAEARELKISLVKSDGQWLFRDFTVEEVLRR